MDVSQKIEAQRAQELAASDYNILVDHKSKTDFIQYFEAYIGSYTKKDKRNMQGACKSFKAFMKQENIKTLTMKQIDEDIVARFAEYLKEHSKGEGAASIPKKENKSRVDVTFWLL